MKVVVVILLAAGIMLSGVRLAWPERPAAPPQAAAPAPEPAPAPAPPDGSPAVAGLAAARVHRVAAGETLSAIAAVYAVDVDTLLAANPEADELIHPGDELMILPGKGALHTVAAGDTLWGLAAAYGAGVAAIRAANGKQDDFLVPGERLFIPGGRAAREPVSRGAARRFVWPAAGEVSSPFGYRWGRLHAGIDIAAEAGSPVRAARGGRVVAAGWRGGYGYTVVIEHEPGLSSLYAHLEDFAVGAGERVATGQLIGFVGDTGYSFGAHLHFEVRVDGQAVNPLRLLP